MVVGSVISMSGMLIAYFESIPAMVLGLILISSGAFFTHTLAYAWVSQKATHAKATATALYLVHYYVGGSLGGFFLIYCWQHGGWDTVIQGGLALYFVLFLLFFKLSKTYANDTQNAPQSGDSAILAANTNLEPK